MLQKQGFFSTLFLYRTQVILPCLILYCVKYNCTQLNIGQLFSFVFYLT